MEVIVSAGVVAAVFSVLTGFVLQSAYFNSKTKAEEEIAENAKKAMDEIVYEIKGAKSVYSPTTTANQLSLETFRYAPEGETSSYIDFFLCGTAVCLKKESLSPLVLTSSAAEISNLQFSVVANGTRSSVKINLTARSKNSSGSDYFSTTLNSAVSLRSY